MSGSIPSELGNLTNLKELYLWGNELSGPISPELGKLTNLEKLYISDNRFSGCVPEAWQDTEENDLEILGLPLCSDREALISIYKATNGANWRKNANWLKDGIALQGWYGVTTDGGRVVGLILPKNELSGTIPSELGDLTNLKGLYLWGNELSGTIPPELGNLKSLERLFLSKNLLSGTIPSELDDLTNLVILDLSDNQLSGTITGSG